MQCRALKNNSAPASWLLQLGWFRDWAGRLGYTCRDPTDQALRRGKCIVGDLAMIMIYWTQTDISEILNVLDASGVIMTHFPERSSLLQVPDASRSSMMVGVSQQDPSTPTSTRAGEPSASSAFASPLQLPEAGVFPQGIPCLVSPEGQLYACLFKC